MNNIKHEMNKIEIPKELSERSKMGVSPAKGKALYYIFFIILLIISFSIYRFIYLSIHPLIPMWNTFADIIYVLLFLVIIVPLTAYLSEKLAKFSLRIGLGKNKYFVIFIAVIVAVPIIMYVNDYKEKDLDDVISFNTANVDYIIVNNEFRTDKKEHAEELKALFSQYRVKKMKDREWDGDVSKEKGFQITIYINGKPIMASIYEGRILLGSGDAYNVVNGPIDMGWVDEIYEEQGQEV